MTNFPVVVSAFHSPRHEYPVGRTLKYLKADQFEPIIARTRGATLWLADEQIVDVLDSEDIVSGIALAVALAFITTFVQGQRPWTDTFNASANTNSTSNIFGAEAWEEMSQPDNYVWYNAKIRNNNERDEPQAIRTEQVWVLLGLLLLFVPVFSFEFYLALSRQFLCGETLLGTQGWAQELCRPHL